MRCGADLFPDNPAIFGSYCKLQVGHEGEHDSEARLAEERRFASLIAVLCYVHELDWYELAEQAQQLIGDGWAAWFPTDDQIGCIGTLSQEMPEAFAWLEEHYPGIVAEKEREACCEVVRASRKK